MKRLVLAVLLGFLACGPDLVFDNPCDPASNQFDPCRCLRCFEPQCQVSGTQCICNGAGEDGEKGWCGTACCRGDEVCFQQSCCTPRCQDRECGDDGCGGTCGSCQACGESCVEGHCLFTACQDRQCGSNGCGGSCGSCGDGLVCQDGRCVLPAGGT